MTQDHNICSFAQQKHPKCSLLFTLTEKVADGVINAVLSFNDLTYIHRTNPRRWGNMLSLFCRTSASARCLIQASWWRSSAESMLVPRSRDTPTYRAVVLFNSCTPCTVTDQPDIHQYRNGALRMVFVPMSCAVVKVWSSFYEHVNQAKRRIVTQCKCGCNKEVNGYFSGSNKAFRISYPPIFRMTLLVRACLTI